MEGSLLEYLTAIFILFSAISGWGISKILSNFNLMKENKYSKKIDTVAIIVCAVLVLGVQIPTIRKNELDKKMREDEHDKTIAMIESRTTALTSELSDMQKINKELENKVDISKKEIIKLRNLIRKMSKERYELCISIGKVWKSEKKFPKGATFEIVDHSGRKFSKIRKDIIYSYAEKDRFYYYEGGKVSLENAHREKYYGFLKIKNESKDTVFKGYIIVDFSTSHEFF